MGLSSDPVQGVLVGAACGDALGAGYEFEPPLAGSVLPRMRGRGAFAPGEWTDDSAQMAAIARVVAAGLDPSSPSGLDAIAAGFYEWYLSPARMKDIGIHTGEVLGSVTSSLAGPGLASVFAAAAAAKEERSPGRSGGNGALMRTAPLALWSGASDRRALLGAARSVAELTHADETSSEACGLWCVAIRAALEAPSYGDAAAVRSAVRDTVSRELPPDRAARWLGWLEEAESAEPSTFARNGWSLHAFQAAWSAIMRTPVPVDDRAAGTSRASHFRLALEAAVRCGWDTDTVACIAGSLLGALWGLSAVPLEWRQAIHGWPDLRDGDLVALAAACADPSLASSGAWPFAPSIDYSSWGPCDQVALHPLDPGVVLGSIGVAQGRVPSPVPFDAVVSLCRVGTEDLAWAGIRPDRHVTVRLIDDASNEHAQYVVDSAADMVARLRSEGRTVLLHCVQAHSRTPTVGARYAVRHLGAAPDEALASVLSALPEASPHPALRACI